MKRRKVSITVARSAGFCTGVKRALRIALDAAQSGDDVRMLGDIVHNEQVVEEIRRAGIRTMRRLGKGAGKALLIRAHGASQSVLRRASERRYRIVDATCPMVREIHRLAIQCERRGCRVIVIGDKKHDEVVGIQGQPRRKALVVESVAQIPWPAIRRMKKVAVLVQSTQNEENAVKIVEAIRRRVPDLEFHNTICRPTREKQREARQLPLRNDVMVVIGSRQSANTRRLYEISRSLNTRTHWVQTARELRTVWFKGCGRVGVLAGASTPDHTIRQVVAGIRERACKAGRRADGGD